MAVPKIVLVPRLHCDFEETVVTVAVLQAFQKLGYDCPSPRSGTCDSLGNDVFVMLPTAAEWQIFVLHFCVYPR